MKKISSLIIIASFLLTSCTKQIPGTDDLIPHQHGVEDNHNNGGGNNTTTIPAAVLSAFNSRYPDAKSIQWKQLSNGNFKAEFFRGAVKWEATFTAAGDLVKEEHN